MNKLLGANEPREGKVWLGPQNEIAWVRGDKLRPHTVVRDRPQSVAFRDPEKSVLCLANIRRIRQHRLEDQIQFTGRRTDDLQYLGGSRLLLQGFGEICGALPQLIEQPRILDGDDGLVDAIRLNVDVLVIERSNSLTINDHYHDNF